MEKIVKVWKIFSKFRKKIKKKSVVSIPFFENICYTLKARKMYSAHHKRYFAFGEDIRTLRLTSELVDLRVGYAKRIQ